MGDTRLISANNMKTIYHIIQQLEIIIVTIKELETLLEVWCVLGCKYECTWATDLGVFL